MPDPTEEAFKRMQAQQAGAPRAALTDDQIATDPRFITQIDPEELRSYAAWKRKFAPKDSGYDYDLHGAFKANLMPDPETGHWPDTFKKPNHETYSDESKFASMTEFPPKGSWNGTDVFTRRAAPRVAPTPAPAQQAADPTAAAFAKMRAATSGSQRQPAAPSGTEAPPVITRHRAEPLDENGKPYWLQLDALGGEGATVKGDMGGRFSKSIDTAINEFSASGQRLKDEVRSRGPFASPPVGATVDYLMKAAGVPFAPIEQGVKEWLGDPLREAPQGKNGRMSARQVMAATIRAPLDLPAGGGMALAQVPGVRQFADATLGSSQPGAPKGHEVLGGALGAVLGAEAFGGRAPGSSALGLAERIPLVRRGFDAAEARMPAPGGGARATWEARWKAQAPRSLAEVADAADALRSQPSTPPNAAPGTARLASAMTPEQRQLPYSPNTGAPGVMLPPARAQGPGAPVEGLFPSVDAELAARARSENPPMSFREAQEARRSGQALAPDRMPIAPEPVELALARASGTPFRSIAEQMTDPPLPPLPRSFLDALDRDIEAMPDPHGSKPGGDPVIGRLAQEARVAMGREDHQAALGYLEKLRDRIEKVDFEKSMEPGARSPMAARPGEQFTDRSAPGARIRARQAEPATLRAADPEPPLAAPAEAPLTPSPASEEAPPARPFGRRGESGGVGLAPPGRGLPSMDDLGNSRLARLDTTIPEAKPGSLREAVERVTNEKIGNLKPYSEDLFHRVKDVLSTASRSTAPDLMELDAILKGMTPEEIQGIGTEMGERRAPAETPKQRALIDWWHRKHPEIKKALNESGSRVVEMRKTADLPETIPPNWNLRETSPGNYLITRPIGTIEDFSPMRMSEQAREVLRAGGEEADMLRDRIYEETRKRNPNVTREDVAEQLKTYQRPSLKRLNPGVERPRKVTLPDDLREQDFVGTIRNYIINARKTVAKQRALNFFDKATGEPRALDNAWSPQGDLGDIIGKIAEDPEKGQGAAEAALHLAEDVLGDDRASWDPAHQNSIKRSNTVGAVNALRLYGIRPTTALVQLTQNAMTASFAGARATAKAVARVTTDWRTSYQEALRAGAVDAPSHYAETIGLREGETAPSGKARILQKATNIATTPMATTDLASRLVAWETRFDVATKLEQQLNGNAWRQGVAKTNLAALDYSPADIQKFKSGMLTGEDMDILGARIVERTQGKVTNASRIDFATHPLGRLALQGKNFGIAQTRNTWRIVGKQLIEAKNPVPAARLLVSTYLVGKGIMAAKDAMLGENKNRPDDIATALKEGGGLGMVGDFAHAAYERGDVGWRQSIDNLTNAQWAGLVEEFGSLGINLAVPKKARVPGTGVSIPKSRSQVFLDALKNAAPTLKEWNTIRERAMK